MHNITPVFSHTKTDCNGQRVYQLFDYSILRMTKYIDKGLDNFFFVLVLIET